MRMRIRNYIKNILENSGKKIILHILNKICNVIIK